MEITPLGRVFQTSQDTPRDRQHEQAKYKKLSTTTEKGKYKKLSTTTEKGKVSNLYVDTVELSEEAKKFVYANYTTKLPLGNKF